MADEQPVPSTQAPARKARRSGSRRARASVQRGRRGARRRARQARRRAQARKRSQARTRGSGSRSQGLPSGEHRLRIEDRLAIVGGGIVGTLLRVLVQELLPPTEDGAPWATLTVNVIGSFVLAALLAHWHRSELPGRALKSLHTAVATGVIGGFTTFSDFAVEATTLAETDPLRAVAYTVGTVTAALAAALAGAGLARRRRRTST